MIKILTLGSLIITSWCFGQSLDKIGKLSSELTEISGLCPFNNDLFICHNDGGNKPILYFIDLKGAIVHQVAVENAKNVDWEDLTNDHKGNLYLADIGNNSNCRKDLCIYKISSDSLLLKNSVKAQKIEFTYEDQLDFPPKKNALYFDAEALGFYNDTLFIFTKCRTDPYDGKSNCYFLLPIAEKQIARKQQTLQLKKRKMRKDAITSCCFDNNRCYLLSYSSIEIFNRIDSQFIFEKSLPFYHWTQKEALALKENVLYLADERIKFLGGKLYQIKF